jgi:uracil-DNA glycosylase
MKVLFVAQNPKHPENLEKPMEGTRSGTILGDWLLELGLKREDVKIINASIRFGQRLKKSDRDAQAILAEARKVTKVVALGRYAGDTLLDLSIPHFRLPHPSGLNRQLNDRSFIHDELALCRSYLDA